MIVEPITKKSAIRAIKRNLADAKNPRDYLLFTLGINTALRISDLLNLKVKDMIDTYGDTAKYLYLKIRKTRKNRKIKLNENSRDAIEYYFKKTGITDPNKYLFTSVRSKGLPLTRVRAFQLVRDWCEDVHLEGNYGCHTLRKTWGFFARTEKGISWELIGQKLGHSSPSVTRRYLGIQQEEISKVEDIVNL